MKKTKLSLALATTLILSTLSYADDASDIQELKQQIKDLEEMTQALVDETSDLKTGFNYTTVDREKSHSGLGPAASKVYYSKSPLSIGGYGEMYYSNTQNEDKSYNSETQVKRFITYFGYKFSDNIILNTEIEYEGGGVTVGGEGDEVKVEFIYLDFLINENFNIRLGNFLIPLGLTNQQHEPTLFTTVQRPSTSYYLIPSTWNESGVMVYGDIINGLEYKVAATTALQTTVDTADGKKPKWIRSGRGGTFEITNPTTAFIGRVDYTEVNGLSLGASLYYAPGSRVQRSSEKADIFMYDLHMDYKINAFRLYGIYTQTNRSNSSKIASDVISSAVEKAEGAYLNASFDILSFTSLEYKLPLFVQYESVNARAKVSSGVSSDAVHITTIGVNFFPHDQVVLKVDYAMADSSFKKYADIESSDTLSFSLGFIF